MKGTVIRFKRSPNEELGRITLRDNGGADDMVTAVGLRRPEYWWGEFVEEEFYIRLIRDLEVERGRLSAHEGVCAERYGQINKTLAAFDAKLDAVINRAASDQRDTFTWRQGILMAVIGLLIAVAGWEAGQLYNLEPQRTVQASH